jgi:hypothetical protein
LAGKYGERENGKAKRDRMQSEWNLFHTTAFTDPNHPYFVYGPVDSFGFMGKYATEEAARAARGEPSELFTPGGTNTEAAKATDTNTEKRDVSQTVKGVPAPAPAQPAEAPSEGGAASSSEPPTPTPTPVGTPTAQPGVLAPRPKVTPTATPKAVVTPTAKPVTKTPVEQPKRSGINKPIGELLGDIFKAPPTAPNPISTVPPKPVKPVAPTARPTTTAPAKPSMTPEQAQAEIAKLAAKVRGGAKLSREEGARVQELKKILGK